MNNRDFFEILQGAIQGNHERLEELLQMYMPMINKYSYLEGQMDEDLKQYILIHIALNIHKFRV